MERPRPPHRRRGGGLGGRAPFSPAGTAAVFSFRAAALYALLGLCGALLPLLTLLCTCRAAAKGASRTVGCACGTLTALALPLLLATSAALLGLAPLVGAAASPAPSRPSSVPTSPPLPGTSPSPLPPPEQRRRPRSVRVRVRRRRPAAAARRREHDSIPLAQVVPEVLQCGAPNHTSNLVDALGLRGVIDFGGALANLTAHLDGALGAFNGTARAPIDAALAELPYAEAAVANMTRAFAPSGLAAALDGVENLTSLMLDTLLPTSAPPPDGTPERDAWNANFAGCYGTPPTGPAQEFVSLNARLRAELDTARNLTAPLAALEAACNATAAEAPAVLAGVRGALLGAAAVCEGTLSMGAALEGLLTSVFDDVSRAEAVTRCGWVGRNYERVRALTCDVGNVQVRALGMLLAAAALALCTGLCVLTCTRSKRQLLALGGRRTHTHSGALPAVGIGVGVGVGGSGQYFYHPYEGGSSCDASLRSEDGGGHERRLSLRPEDRTGTFTQTFLVGAAGRGGGRASPSEEGDGYVVRESPVAYFSGRDPAASSPFGAGRAAASAARGSRLSAASSRPSGSRLSIGGLPAEASAALLDGAAASSRDHPQRGGALLRPVAGARW